MPLHQHLLAGRESHTAAGRRILLQQGSEG